jgi:hypothetical protein
MSIEQVLKGFDKIESRLAQLPELADRILQLEQRGAHRDAGDLPGAAAQTLGANFTKALRGHADEFARNRRISLEVATKALITSAQVGARASMGATPGSGMNPTDLAAVLAGSPLSGVQSLTYARRLGVTEGFNAKPQNGEGVAKQEVTPNYSSVTQNQITVAGYINISEQALSNDGELAAAIDLFLQADIIAAVSKVLAGGSTAAGSTFEGFLALASVIESPAHLLNTLEVTIANAALQMRSNGYSPTVCVLSSTEWARVALRADAVGQYINGSPLSATPGLSISGMRVAFSAEVPALKALLIDERFAGWGLSNNMRIDANYVNDGFIKNIVTLRGELAMVPFVRDIGAVRLAQRTAP